MASIDAEVTVKSQSFPVGTVDTGFTISLLRASDRFVYSTETSGAQGAVFPNVPTGDLIVVATANGVSVEAPITVVATSSTLLVPASITPTFTP